MISSPMRGGRTFLIGLVGLLLCLHSAPAAAQQGPQTKVVLIGVESFVSPSLHALGAVPADLQLMRQTLTGSCGVPSANVTTLHSTKERPLSRGQVQSSLKNLFANAGPSDALLVYVTSHGVTYEGDYQIAMTESRISPQDIMKTTLGAAEIKQLMATSKAKTVLVLLDTCQSSFTHKDVADIAARGMAMSSKASQSFTKDVAKRFLGQPGSSAGVRAILYSCRPSEESYMDTEGITGTKNSFFTFAVCEGLKGKAAAANGEVNLERLQAYTTKVINDLTVATNEVAVSKGQQPALPKAQTANMELLGGNPSTFVLATVGAPSGTQQQAVANQQQPYQPTTTPPVAYQPPGQQAPAYQQPVAQAPTYQPPVIQTPAYQPPYQPPAAAPQAYQQPATYQQSSPPVYYPPNYQPPTPTQQQPPSYYPPGQSAVAGANQPPVQAAYQPPTATYQPPTPAAPPQQPMGYPQPVATQPTPPQAPATYSSGQPAAGYPSTVGYQPPGGAGAAPAGGPVLVQASGGVLELYPSAEFAMAATAEGSKAVSRAEIPKNLNPADFTVDVFCDRGKDDANIRVTVRSEAKAPACNVDIRLLASLDRQNWKPVRDWSFRLPGGYRVSRDYVGWDASLFTPEVFYLRTELVLPDRTIMVREGKFTATHPNH